MDLKDVAVLKEGHALIEGAEGKVANGRLVVVADPVGELDVGDRVTITAAHGFEARGTYMGGSAGDLNFKID